MADKASGLGGSAMKEQKTKGKSSVCSPVSAAGCNCCKIESLISVDDRGQMILPKPIRERAGIKPGDKLALITWESDGNICCLSLVKADDMAELAKNMLGPLMAQMK